MFGISKEINKSRAWNKLNKYARKMQKVEMKDMFAHDKNRAARFSLDLDNMHLDYSKNLIDAKAMLYLLALAKKADLQSKIAQMFAGAKINSTEKRAVLHTALRNRDNHPIYVDGQEYAAPEVTFDYDFSQRHIMVVNNWLEGENVNIQNEIMVVFADNEVGTSQADGFNGLAISGQ